MADPDSGDPKSKVFISYSRKDKEFVHRLNDGLVQSGVQTWVDWEGIPLSADWMAEIRTAIEGSDSILFVLSPDSAGSKYCGEELTLAIGNKKKVIPILHRELPSGVELHEKLAATNWVYMRAEDDFDATLPKLVSAIGTDLVWVRQHTRLLTRAIEWDGCKRNSSYLLRGADLEDAEQWQIRASSRDSRDITPLQAEYIRASRQQFIRGQRNLLVQVSIILVMTLFLAVYAFLQREVAVDNERLAKNNAATAVANENARATQQAIAYNNAATAVANENARATQQAIAVANAKLAEQNAELARQQSIIAQAQGSAARATLLKNHPEQFYLSTLLAIQSLKLYPNPEARLVLRQDIALLTQPGIYAGHDGEITALRLSLDGARLATASLDGTARIWDLATGQELLRLAHPDQVTAAAFTPDGRQLVTGSRDGQVITWDAASGEQLRAMQLPAGVTALAVSPDNQTLTAGREDGLASVLNLSKGELVTTLKHDNLIYDLAYSPNSALILSGGEDGYARLWHARTGKAYARTQHGAGVLTVAFSPDAKWFATASADGTARIGQTATGDTTAVLLHNEWVEDALFSADSRRLVTSSDDGQVNVWEVPSGRNLLKLSHTGFVQFLAVSPDGNWVASASSDRTARIWDILTGQMIALIPLGDYGTFLEFTQDGQSLITTTEKGEIRTWFIPQIATRTGRLLQTELVRALAASPDGRWIAAGTDERWAWLYPAEGVLAMASSQAAESELKPTRLLKTPGFWERIRFSPDSAWLAALDGSPIVRLKNLAGDSQPFELAATEPLSDLAFSPDSRRLATASDQDILLWDLAGKAQAGVLTNTWPVTALAWAPDGKHLAAAGQSALVVWDLDAGDSTPHFRGLPETISRMAYSPDGRWLVAAGQKQARIWDMLAGPGAPLYKLAHGSEITDLAISGNGRWLSTAQEDGLVRIWDLAGGEELGVLENPYKVFSLTFAGGDGRLLVASGKTATVWDLTDMVLISSAELVSAACNYLIYDLSFEDWQLFFGDEPYNPICPGLPRRNEMPAVSSHTQNGR